MRKVLCLGISSAAIIAIGLTSTAGWAATTSPAASGPSAGGPGTTVTFAVTVGALSLTAPATVDLGSGAPGATITGDLGPVTVTDDRALLGAAWTATASSTDFISGGGTTDETIPAGDVSYDPGTITHRHDHHHGDTHHDVQCRANGRHRHRRRWEQQRLLGSGSR